MSDPILKLIPRQPNYIPAIEQQVHAAEVVKLQFPHADSVTTHTSDTVQFIDAGENWGEIRCPSCDAILDIEWWASAMDECSESDFQRLNVTTLCCNSDVSLNELAYEFPVGFSRFVLQILNPGVTNMEDRVREDIEKVLHCGVKVIWAYV